MKEVAGLQLCSSSIDSQGLIQAGEQNMTAEPSSEKNKKSYACEYEK